MKNKLILIVIALLFAGSAYCQIPEVMVGDTTIIVHYLQPRAICYPSPYNEFCRAEDFQLAWNSNKNFYQVEIGSINTTTPLTVLVYFLPKLTGIQYDSTSWGSMWDCSDPGKNYFVCVDSVYAQFIAKGVDSVVVVKFKDPTIILPLDTLSRKYKSKIDPFYFYSNIADSVLFDSWQLIIDPSAKISFTVDSNSNALSEYTSKPFTRKKQLNFTFTSTLAATDTAQSFPATMKTRVRYKGVDSIYSNTFTIILPAAPKSDVRNISHSDISFTINPNPFSKQTTFIVTTSNSEPVTLEIYDLLGNRKEIITIDEHINGVHDFHFDASGFTAGSYFARLVCGKNVFTRKLIIK